MKKIVLLSLALFSVAALRAEGPADWAQYGRYELQNAVLDRPVEVVFMGNSITDGWIRVDPDFFERNGFLDRGISGQMLARFRSDVIDLKPQVVVILAGINDIARNNGPIKLENVFGNIVSMCDLARYNGIKVVLCSLLPCDRFSWRPEMDPAEEVRRLNTMLEDSLCGLPSGARQRQRRNVRRVLPRRLPSGSFRLFADGAAGRRRHQPGARRSENMVYNRIACKITDK